MAQRRRTRPAAARASARARGRCRSPRTGTPEPPRPAPASARLRARSWRWNGPLQLDPQAVAARRRRAGARSVGSSCTPRAAQPLRQTSPSACSSSVSSGTAAARERAGAAVARVRVRARDDPAQVAPAARVSTSSVTWRDRPVGAVGSQVDLRAVDRPQPERARRPARTPSSPRPRRGRSAPAPRAELDRRGRQLVGQRGAVEEREGGVGSGARRTGTNTCSHRLADGTASASAVELQPRVREAGDAPGCELRPFARRRHRRDAHRIYTDPRGHALRRPRAGAASAHDDDAAMLHAYVTPPGGVRDSRSGRWSSARRGALIGDAGLFSAGASAAEVEVGYTLGIAAAGARGYATEAARRVPRTPRSAPLGISTRWSRSSCPPTAPRCACVAKLGMAPDGARMPLGASTWCSGQSATHGCDSAGHDQHEQLLGAVYVAFNARDIDASIAAMHPDVDWRNAWEGGRLHGRDAVREYWTRQCRPRSTRMSSRARSRRPRTAASRSRSTSVRSPAGEVARRRHGDARLALRDGLVERMDVDQRCVNHPPPRGRGRRRGRARRR